MPSSASDAAAGFWSERKTASVLKHGVLRRYLPVFVTKTGTYSLGNRVVYFDGYAGKGRYDDGTQGSPLIAAEIARGVASLSQPRKLDLFLVERGRAEYRELVKVMMAEEPELSPQIRHGNAGDYVDELIAYANVSPMFALLDPYGLGLPMSSVIKLMNRPLGPRGRLQTEVLINFSDIMIRRIGGLLTTSKPHPRDSTTLAKMDAVCGGRWWRSAYADASLPAAGVRVVVDGYRQRLRGATQCGDWCVPVRNRINQEPRYYLVFLSRHPDGLWEFAEGLSLATDVWRGACDEALSRGMEPLFDLEEPMEEKWIQTIAVNIDTMIASRAAPFAVRQCYGEIMGDTLGLARSKHIRAAVKRLYNLGRTATEGKGDVAKMVIFPPSPH
jgi:three-Cys-motif partner protein